MRQALGLVNASCIVPQGILRSMKTSKPDERMAARLREARELAGYPGPTEAARALGIKPPTYLGHENGSRGFVAQVQFYARRYRVSLEWLLSGKGTPRSGDVNFDNSETATDSGASAIPLSASKNVRHLGDVTAGLWREAALFDLQEEDLPLVQVASIFDAADLFVLRIQGPSINRRAPSGSDVLCVKLEAAPRSFRDGDLVVVERESHGKFETTIKVVKGREGAWQLWPDSTDARYQTPVPLGEHEDETVRVIGFAIKVFRDLMEF